MIIDVVKDMLNERWRPTFEVADRVWVLFEGFGSPEVPSRNDQNCAMWVSKCPGGSYHFFAQLSVDGSGVTLRARTVWSIFRRTNHAESFLFEYCDPAFPDNLFEFVDRAATNALKCYQLDNTRSHARRRRGS